MTNEAVAFRFMVDVGDRLRAAISAKGLKQSWLAAEAGIPAETLSRILTRTTENPGVYTLQKVARVIGETVGSLLGEPGFDVTADDRDTIERFIAWAEMKLLKTAPPKLEARDRPNASRVTITLAEDNVKNIAGRVSKRRVKISEPDPRRMAQSLPAAATPGREVYADPDAPEREIPGHYYEIGARLIRKADGDSMIGVGITDRDLMFIKPTESVAEAKGHVVVCAVGDSEFVKILRVNGAIELHSANDRYGPWILSEDETERFKLVGIVVGRSGYPAI